MIENPFNEYEEKLLKTIFKMAKALLYETNITTDNGSSIDENDLFSLEQKLGIYEIVE